MRPSMTVTARPAGRALAAGVLAVVVLVCAAPAYAGGPSKWLLKSTIGHDVNETATIEGAPQEERNECTVESGDECQFGEEGNGEPRALPYARSVAADPRTGAVYVADNNHRIQKLGPAGEFLLMWGWDVNKTKVALGAGATQQEKNICTAASGDECGGGERGTNGEPTGLAEQLGAQVVDVTVDPATGNVYALETEYDRVEEFTESGEFALMFGGDVNRNGTSVCLRAEQSNCQRGREGSAQGEFNSLEPQGNDITFGPDSLLYVGDERRVQKFQADGEASGQIAVAGNVGNLGVDAAGDVFVSERNLTGVHEYSATGVLQPCELKASEYVDGLAVDAYGRFGVSYYEGGPHVVIYRTGSECGAPVVSEVLAPSEERGAPNGLAFSLDPADEDRLYVLHTFHLELYEPVLFPEARTCAPSEVAATSAMLCGEVDPNTIATTAFFKYGPSGSALEGQTPVAFTGAGEAFAPFAYALNGLVPNQLYSYEAWVQAESKGTPTSAGGPPPASFHTSTPPPEVPGAPQASFVTSESAQLSAYLDPEHAQTAYRFQYAPCPSAGGTFAQCAAAQSTEALASAQYGSILAIQDAVGLQPQTTYVYRLLADNRFAYEGKPEGGQTTGAEGHFTTAPLAAPTAETGPASAVGTNSAVIAGYVNGGGEAATYTFELGIDEGQATQYGVVASGSAGAAVGAVQETATLAGLQPGTAYSYRIRIDSGYGHMLGASASFTTQGVPELLQTPAVLPILAMPNCPGSCFPSGAGRGGKGTASKRRGARPRSSCRARARRIRSAKRRRAALKRCTRPTHKRNKGRSRG